MYAGNQLPFLYSPHITQRTLSIPFFIASPIPISLDRHTEPGIATEIAVQSVDVVAAASDGNGIYLARLDECDPSISHD